MTKPLLRLTLLACLATPLSAQADLSIGVRLGTLGPGLEIAKLVTDNIAVRAAVHRFSGDFDETEEDIEYAVSGKLKGVTALVDLYPSRRGSFHFTAGLLTTPAELTGTGQPNGDSYTINGNEYSAAEVGTVKGAVIFPETSPYVGLGWGTPASRRGGLGFVFDLGVAFGTPKLDLTATSAIPGSPLAADVEAERLELQDNFDRYFKVYPVLSLGLVYKF
jgi:hypothetical protein